jgi:hypothetical protein
VLIGLVALAIAALMVWAVWGGRPIVSEIFGDEPVIEGP